MNSGSRARIGRHTLPDRRTQMSKPIISVITAVYNAESTIAHAMASVAEQTWPGVEHIIVEGNSSDGSLDVIRREMGDGVRLISEPDKGIYDALNKGIRHASGDVVGFLHSDDFYAHPGALARIGAAFEEPGIEAVYSDLDYVSQADPDRIVRRWSTGPFARAKLKLGWMPAHPTLFVRREVYREYGDYDTGFAIAADYDFILRYFSRSTAPSCYIPEVLYKMRMGGVSNRNIRKIIQKSSEDLLALRRNGVGGVPTLAWKNLSKIGQFRT